MKVETPNAKGKQVRYTYTTLEKEYAILDNEKAIKTYPIPKKLKAQKGMINNIESEVRELNANVEDMYLTDRERQRLLSVFNLTREITKPY